MDYALFSAKTSDFLKGMLCPHGQGGRGCWASADIFRTRVKGVNFSWFCADVLYGQLWASAAGGREAEAPLDFHTWYIYSNKGLNSSYFSIFFAIFRIFPLLPPLEVA